MGIYELVKINEEFKNLIHKQVHEAELEKLARTYSKSIRQDGVDKLCQGLTSVDEILRVT